MKMAQGSWKPDAFKTNNWGQLLQEAVDGFLIVVSKKGTIILLTEAIGHLLGHNQFDLIGRDIETIIHPDDVKLFRAQFLPRHYSGTYPDSGSSTRSFYVRFLNVNYRESACYTMIHIVGQLQEMSLLTRDSNLGNGNDIWLNGVGRVLQKENIQNISILDGGKNEWVTQHAMDGQILYTDPRSCHVTGLMPSENFGTSVYLHIVPEDIYFVGKSHQKILVEGEVPSTIFRLQTANDHTYVESRSCVARDSWTHQPKFIVSLNTQLSIEEGKQKLEKQKRDNPEIDLTDADALVSEVIESANSLTNYSSTQVKDHPFGFTSHGDVFKAMDKSDHLFEDNMPKEDCVTNNRKRKLEDIDNNKHLSHQDSTLESFPDLNSINLSSISSSDELMTDNVPVIENSDLSPPTHNDVVNSASDFNSSNENRINGQNNNSQMMNTQETTFLSDILNGKGSSRYSQNSCNNNSYTDFSKSYPDTCTSDNSQESTSVSSCSTQSYQLSTSPTSYHHPNKVSTTIQNGHHNESENLDETRIFSNQLKKKHFEIAQSLTTQLAEIKQIEEILVTTSEHSNTPEYLKLQDKLTQIKGKQRLMNEELEILKKNVTMTTESSTYIGKYNEINNPEILYGSTAMSPNGNSTCSSAESIDSLPGDYTRADFSSHYYHHRSPRSPVYSPKAQASFSKSSSCKDSVSFVCDGYRSMTSEDRIRRIKTALGRIPVPKTFSPPPKHTSKNFA